MPSSTRRISTQEATLRTSLGLNGAWLKLSEKQKLKLREQYRLIIAAGMQLVNGYDSELRDIRKGINKIEAISPFKEDQSSINERQQALEKVASVLHEHGLPYPLPTNQSVLRALKHDWPKIKTNRRRLIRQEWCRRLSLPLNTGWEIISKQQLTISNEGSSSMVNHTESHIFMLDICKRCGVSKSAAERFDWGTCHPIKSPTPQNIISQIERESLNYQGRSSDFYNKANGESPLCRPASTTRWQEQIAQITRHIPAA